MYIMGEAQHLVLLTHNHTPTNKVKSRGQELPCQDGSGNGPDQGEVHHTVNVCQVGRFGRRKADGKVGCQPRECEVRLLTPVAERLDSYARPPLFLTFGTIGEKLVGLRYRRSCTR